ncbi:hypothetical protein WG66_004022 [Moniliophthora roreri]|nr:hypothetical protein WG66_004022 [Moniliophthora roreri]
MTGGGKGVEERILSHDPFLLVLHEWVYRSVSPVLSSQLTSTSYEYLEEKGTPQTLDPSVVPCSIVSQPIETTMSYLSDVRFNTRLEEYKENETSPSSTFTRAVKEVPYADRKSGKHNVEAEAVIDACWSHRSRFMKSFHVDVATLSMSKLPMPAAGTVFIVHNLQSPKSSKPGSSQHNERTFEITSVPPAPTGTTSSSLHPANHPDTNHTKPSKLLLQTCDSPRPTSLSEERPPRTWPFCSALRSYPNENLEPWKVVIDDPT